MSNPQQSRVLRVALGQPIVSVQQSGGILLHLDRLLDNSPAILDEIVSVHYDDPNYGFQLPPTRFVMISQAAGVVTGLDTSPQLTFSSLADTHALALQMIGIVQRAHWEPEGIYPIDLAALERLVADPNRGSRRFARDYADFHLGSASLRIYIREAIGIGLEGRTPPAKGHLFLVNVDIVDSHLASSAIERVYAKRQEIKGDINQSLPLSIWLNGKP